MAIRARRGRGGAAAATRSSRSTRQNPAIATAEVQEEPETSVEAEQGGLLVQDPIPQRNAPRIAQDQVTIPSQREEDDEDEDDEDDYEDAEDQAQEQAQDQGPDQGEDQEQDSEEISPEEDNELRLAVMAAGLDDVSRHTLQMWTRLINPDYESEQFRMILRMKRKAFLAIREEYEDQHIYPFTDTSRLRLLDLQTGGDGAAITTLRKMNLTTALDFIDQVLQGEPVEQRNILSSLAKGTFPFLFAGNPDQRFAPSAVLDILTYLFIERLQNEPAAEYNKILAEVFCNSKGNTNYPNLFSHGPFRSLGGKNKGEEETMVADRIQKLIPLAKKDRKARGSEESALRDAYPVAAFFGALREFMIGSWPQELESQWDIEGTPSVIESQPIQRPPPPGSAPARHSITASQDALRALAHISPSVRRQTMPAQRFVSPDSASAQIAEDAARAAAAATLANVAEGGPIYGDNDDEEAAFQTDRRAIMTNSAIAKRPAAMITTNIPKPKAKRQRVSSAHHDASQARFPPPYQTQPSTAGNNLNPSSSMPPPPTAPNFDAIKARKREVNEQLRALRPDLPTQQRKPWSAKDCTTLLTCIWERHASWAQIQEHGSHLFETPRNQQAYRDKARNMKVDYLITDEVLPPCFDLVALGKKEIERLRAMGKNPNRREADLDQDGRPVNCAYPEILPQGLQEEDEAEREQHQQHQHQQLQQGQAPMPAMVASDIPDDNIAPDHVLQEQAA